MISADVQKVDLLGEDYIFDLAQQRIHDELYQIYMTDGLKLGLTILADLNRMSVDYPRYYDMVHGVEPEREKTSEEVKQGILDEYKRLGGGN